MLICTRPGIAGRRAGTEALASMLAEGMPVRTKDFITSTAPPVLRPWCCRCEYWRPRSSSFRPWEIGAEVHEIHL